MFTRSLTFLCLAGAVPVLCAQAHSTALRTADFQIGGGLTNARSDYLPNRLNGGMAYFDFDFTHHLGLEGAFHFIKDHEGSDIYEKTYEIGGRYHFTDGRFLPYAKLMYGRGVFNFAAYPGYSHPNLAYNLIAIGGGLDYRVKAHLNARVDFEYQRWLGFPTNSLTPALLSIGASYHF